MNENVKPMCICDLGYDKGVLKKTIENNIFTIYGNITKRNYIILRYHGELIDNVNFENYTNNLYISYFFDNNNQKKEKLCLAKCTKCIGENYCVLIYLDEYSKINFEFSLTSDIDTIQPEEEPMSFELNIKNNPLSDMMEKIEKEEVPCLPVAPKDSEIQFKYFINKIKMFFSSMFTKKDVA